MRIFVAFLGKRLIMHRAGCFRIERKLKLLVPIEQVASAGESVVPNPAGRDLRLQTMALTRAFVFQLFQHFAFD